MRIAIIAALPGELAPLVARWKKSRTLSRYLRKWTLVRGGNEWIAVCAGMGADAARRAYSEAERDGALSMVLSMGWAGALTGSIPAESIVRPSGIVDAQTGESFSLVDGVPGTRLVTTVRVADAPEKVRLHQTYNAVAVDMEAATIARLAEMRGTPMACIKAISDSHDAALPDMNRFVDQNGRMKMPQFLAHIAVRPKFWVPLARLGQHSAAGARAMRDTIETWMEGKDAERTDDAGRAF